MKKQILTIAAVATLVAGSVNAVFAEDTGVLHLSGQIGQSSCVVSSADLNQPVDLGAHTAAEVTATKINTLVADAKEVSFHVSGCDDSKTTASVELTYQNPPNDVYDIQNTGAGRGVIIRPINKFVAKGNSTLSADVIKTGTDSSPVTLASGAGTVNFWVALQKNNDNVNEGALTGTVNVAMKYQ